MYLLRTYEHFRACKNRGGKKCAVCVHYSHTFWTRTSNPPSINLYFPFLFFFTFSLYFLSPSCSRTSYIRGHIAGPLLSLPYFASSFLSREDSIQPFLFPRRLSRRVATSTDCTLRSAIYFASAIYNPHQRGWMGGGFDYRTSSYLERARWRHTTYVRTGLIVMIQQCTAVNTLTLLTVRGEENAFWRWIQHDEIRRSWKYICMLLDIYILLAIHVKVWALHYFLPFLRQYFWPVDLLF